MAVFTPAYNPQHWLPVIPRDEVKDRGLPDVSPAELAEIERHNAEVDRPLAELGRRLSRAAQALRGPALRGEAGPLPEAIRADTSTAVRTPAAKRTRSRSTSPASSRRR